MQVMTVKVNYDYSLFYDIRKYVNAVFASPRSSALHAAHAAKIISKKTVSLDAYFKQSS